VEADFWTRYSEDIKSMLIEGETATINKFGGILQVKSSRRTHARIEAYTTALMERVRRQVFISVQIIRVDLTNATQFGVDWNVAAFNATSNSFKPLQVGGTFEQPGGTVASGLFGATNLTTAGNASIPSPSFSGVITANKISALIKALSQQGKVKTETKPEIATLNNVPAFVQLSEDRAFFRKTTSTTFNNGTTGTGGSTPTTEVQFEERVVSFGNLLEVVPQISDDGEVQLSVQPSITDLRGVDTSPDNASTSPRQGVSRLRSIITLHDGETYVMGGFISDSVGEETRRIPILGDIPYAGALFRTDTKSKTRSEMAVLITVKIRQPHGTAPKEVLIPKPGPVITPKAPASAAPLVVAEKAKTSEPVKSAVIKPVEAEAAIEVNPVAAPVKTGEVIGMSPL
jgi:general secretion pathway protein D